MTQKFELAPAAIVRIASCPYEHIAALASAELARAAAELDPASRSARSVFEAAYELELSRERAELWRRTASDERFRAALAMASASLTRTIGRGLPEGPRTKRIRHRETSLYRYLARAVSRPEPNGLFCSVTIARFGSSETKVRFAAPGVHLAPELAPFRALVLALAGSEPYRSRGPYRLNPSLAGAADGQFRYLRRDPHDGKVSSRTLAKPALGRLLSTRLTGITGDLSALAHHLSPSIGDQAAQAAVRYALDAGLLVGGLRFPGRFESPWEALSQLARELVPAHQLAWSETCASVLASSEALARDLSAVLEKRAEPDLDVVARVEACSAQIGAHIVELSRKLEISAPPLPAQLLRCDLAAPFHIELGRADRQRLEDLLEDWAGLEREWAVADREARRVRAVLTTTDGSPFSTASMPPHCRAERPVTRRVSPEAGPPLGAFILRPGARGLAEPRIQGMSNVATAAHARHAYHLAQRGDPLLPWFRQALRELGQAAEVRVADLVHEHAPSPNVVARPRYVELVLDPWSADLTVTSAARLVEGPSSGSLLLETEGGLVSAHAFTASSATREDPLLARLVATSFDARASDPATPTDPDAVASPPCRRSERGAVLLPQRWELASSEVDALRAARGVDRYLCFRKLCERHGLPELVRLFREHGPGLLLVASSPLAVEAAFEGLGGDEAVALEDVPESPWLTGPEGTHMVELVVPVRRTRHLWQRAEQASVHEDRVAHGS
jgi:hypothetical protein